jgi:hypothetical protein
VTTLAPTLQAFFTDRLARQRQASPHTIAAYRDALKLLLGFAAQRTGKQPSTLAITDLDAPLIGAFLDHLEHERGNKVRTRNARQPPCTHCSASPLCDTPSRQPSSNESWPSHPNASITRSSLISPKPRRPRCCLGCSEDSGQGI